MTLKMSSVTSNRDKFHRIRPCIPEIREKLPTKMLRTYSPQNLSSSFFTIFALVVTLTSDFLTSKSKQYIFVTNCI